nr:MAG TPA: hypothetical protein [Caudoviricetes sp.]
MTKEQEKAIEKIKRKILLGKCEKNIGIPVYISELETVLSMLKEKDKIIDLMSEQLTTPIHDKEWVKQYFENKAKERR